MSPELQMAEMFLLLELALGQKMQHGEITIRLDNLRLINPVLKDGVYILLLIVKRWLDCELTHALRQGAIAIDYNYSVLE